MISLPTLAVKTWGVASDRAANALAGTLDRRITVLPDQASGGGVERKAGAGSGAPAAPGNHDRPFGIEVHSPPRILGSFFHPKNIELPSSIWVQRRKAAVTKQSSRKRRPLHEFCDYLYFTKEQI